MHSNKLVDNSKRIPPLHIIDPRKLYTFVFLRPPKLFLIEDMLAKVDHLIL